MLLITNLNKVVVIVYGMLFLSEPCGPFAIGGCAVALVGGMWYALVRRSLGAQAKAGAPAAASTSSRGAQAAKSSAA